MFIFTNKSDKTVYVACDAIAVPSWWTQYVDWNEYIRLLQCWDPFLPECFELAWPWSPLIDSEPRLFCDTLEDWSIVYFWQVAQFDVETGEFIWIQNIWPDWPWYEPQGSVNLCSEWQSFHVVMCSTDWSWNKYHQCIVKSSEWLISKTYFEYVSREKAEWIDESNLLPCEDICEWYLNSQYWVPNWDYNLTWKASCVLLTYNVSQNVQDTTPPAIFTISWDGLTWNGIIRVRPWCEKKVEFNCAIIEKIVVSGVTSGDVDIEVYH